MPKTPASPIKSPEFREISPGVHIYIGGGGQTNFGLILTGDKPVIIDSDMRVRKHFLKYMRGVTRKNAGLVLNTHHNFDHTSDNGYHVRRGAVTVGAGLIRQEMERELRGGSWAAALDKSGFHLGHLAPGLDFDPPMLTFDDRLEVRYGGRLFQLIRIGHCHTRGDSVIWMPEEKILFSGDLIANRSHTATGQADLENWRRELPRLKKFPALRFIPGHGALPTRGSKIVDENITYFKNLRRRVAAALKKESSPQKAAALVQMPECKGWTRPHNLAANALNMAKHLKKVG
mgnify:FL=1